MKRVSVALLYFIVAFISVNTYALILVMVNGEGLKIFSLNPDYNLTYLVVGLTTSVIVSVSEELIFRGLLFNYLIKKIKFENALLSQSILFALAHMIGSLANGNCCGDFLTLYFINMFAGGILLGLIYFDEETIIAPISFHLAWNFTAYNLLGLSNQPSYVVANTTKNAYYGAFEKDLLTLLIFIILLVLKSMKVKSK